MTRGIWILALLLWATGAGAAHPSAGVLLSVTDASEAPFSSPILRLVPIAPGTSTPTATVRPAADGSTPAVTARALAPMVVRGLTVLPVIMTTVAGKSAAAIPHTVELEVSGGGQKSPEDPQTERAVRYGRSLFQSMAELLPPDTPALTQAAQDGGYLIITAGAFRQEADSLASWKTRRGLHVSVVNVEDVGNTKEAIQAYISRLYHEASIPPEFVILLGDVEFIPTFGLSGAVSDHPYAMMDGGDFFPDLFVGRLSVASVADAQTVVAKIIRYEREPYLADGGAWMGHGLTVGWHTHAMTAIPVCDYCRDQLLSAGFDSVRTAYSTTFPPAGARAIAAAVNRGVSVIAYRGWADAERGWDQQFDTDDVLALHNGQPLPLVCSFVCANNKYDTPECFGEAWLRAGSPSQPQGGIGFIGNSESWSHTRFNDAAAIGAFDGVGSHGYRKLGQVLLAAKTHLFLQWPLNELYSEFQEESVEFYYYIYNLLGDPELEFWAGPPRLIAVTHPLALSPQSNSLRAAVKAQAGGAPVAGVLVGLVQGERLLAGGRTDDAGLVDFPLSGLTSSEPVRITVTGGNCMPYQGLIPVSAAVPLLAAQETVVIDDGSGQSRGNGDTIPNPGETLELRVTAMNAGALAVPQSLARLTSAGGDQVLVSESSFGPVEAGASVQASVPFVVRIDPRGEDGSLSVFRLRCGVGADTSVSEIRLRLTAPALTVDSWAFLEGPGIRPSGSKSLTLHLRNAGGAPAGGVHGVLRSLNRALATVVDSTSDFGDIPAGGSGANSSSLRVSVPADAVIGQAANLELTLSGNGGWESKTSLAIPIGEADVASPLGPNRRGYWAVDSADTDYPNVAPTYDWIECSPLYGGAGVKQTIVDNLSTTVTLPFDFVYYGQTYRQLAVSENGWVSFDLKTSFDSYNFNLPSPYGCGARIAPFWDNLVSDREAGSAVVFDGVYTYYDQNRHAFVVEWSRLKNRDQSPPPPPEPQIRVTFDALQTFEVLLYDPAFYPQTLDGRIEFQYKQIFNVDINRMYSTVGIESERKDDALVYSYSNIYPPQAAPLSAGLAIRFTTTTPRYVPFSLTDFQSQPAGTGILLRWTPVDGRPRSGYRVYRARPGEEFATVSQASLEGTARSFLDLAAQPAGEYLYMIGSIDPSGRETEHGPFRYLGGTAAQLSLSQRGASPMRGSCELSLSLPQAGAVLLQVHDVAGRAVRTLLRGPVPGGARSVLWEGTDDDGRPLPSGVYFVRVKTAEGERRVRLTLIR